MFVIAIARLIGGKPVASGRIRLASIIYAVVMSLLYCALGFGIGEGIRAE